MGPGRAGNEGVTAWCQVPKQDGQVAEGAWPVTCYTAQLKAQIPVSKADSQAAKYSLGELQLQTQTGVSENVNEQIKPVS